MDIASTTQIILIHLPTLALATTLIFLFRALRSAATDRPQRAALFTANDTPDKWQYRTQRWQQQLRILRQITSINAICLSACLVTLLFTYAFPPFWVAAFTIAYLLVITPYLLKNIPILQSALIFTLSRQR